MSCAGGQCNLWYRGNEALSGNRNDRISETVLRGSGKKTGNLKGRGVVLKEGQTLKDLYEERTSLYETYADLTISEKNRGIEETLQAIRDELNM